MQATIVFEKNWEAIHAVDENGKRKYRYIINTGSSRSSKTYSILQSHYLKAWEQSGKRISIWRDTKKDTKDTVLADFKKALPSFENQEFVRFNKTESIYTFPNNSTIEISGSDDENKVHGFQGDVLHLNEPYKIRKEVFDQLDMRTSDYVLIDWNPKTSHWIDTLAKQDNAIVIDSTFRDNPFCPEEQRIKIESYQPVSHTSIGTREYKASDYTEKQIKEVERAIKNEDQDSADAYMWMVYGLGKKSEKPNKIYTNWKKISLAEYIALPYDEYYGLDFGLANPTALVSVKYNDHTFYFHELLYKPEKEMTEGLIPELERIGIDKNAQMVCDSANPEKIIELRNAGFNAIPAFKGAGSVFSGISLIQRANVCYTATSTNLENEYDNFEWDTDRMGILDKPIKFLDHLHDGCRYICSYLAIKLRISI